MKHRDPHNRDGQRGHERGQQDLIGRVDDRFLQRSARGEVGVDVFNHDRGIVDQNADGECQAPQGHDVNRLFLNMQENERAQDRERERGEDDERRSPGSQEE